MVTQRQGDSWPPSSHLILSPVGDVGIGPVTVPGWNPFFVGGSSSRPLLWARHVFLFHATPSKFLILRFPVLP